MNSFEVIWEDEVYKVKAGIEEIGLSCIGDQILVLEDKFKTGWECSKCEGECYLGEDCDFCNGTGKENNATDQEVPCRMCCPKNLLDSFGCMPGKKICDRCGGRGSLIIAPQISQQKPASGTIVSIGPDVYPDCRIINNVTGQRWAYPMKMGDRVLYGHFAGSDIRLKQKELVRVMHAHEVLLKLRGRARYGDFAQ